MKGAGISIGDSAVPWCTGGYYLDKRPVFTLDPAFHAGAYYVQEASSMFLDHMVRQLFPERSGLRVLDLCGAPGGKSSLLAGLLDSTSLLISNEVIRSRASILEENMIRWGYTNNWVTSNDPKSFSALPGYFDLIVVDAPCSGSGLFRKDERALNEWTEANVLLCSQRQQRILADVWDSLKEDGVLIYATCSYSPEEDEGILDWLGATFAPGSLPVPVASEWGVTEVTGAGLAGYRFFPDKVQGEGFFIAAVRKRETAATIARPPKFRTQHDPKTFALAQHLVSNPEELICLPGKENGFFAIRREHEPDLHQLKQHLFFRKTGLRLGMPAGKDWLPEHDTALSLDRSVSVPAVSLDRDQALKFLKKEEVPIALREKGWLLTTYEGLGIGWMKSLGNRYNNYLPKHWRIRMELPDEDWA